MVDSQQTTKFNDDLLPAKASLPRPHMDRSLLQSSREEGRDHTIKDILERPVLVASGVWSITDAIGATLFVLDITPFLSSTNVASKVNGWFSLRGTWHCKLTINAQPMQQGRLSMGFLPRLDSTRIAQLDETLYTRTQRPRVDIDAAVDTNVTLSMPYISPYLGINLTDGTGRMGQFSAWVYSPLLTPSGPTTVGYSVYMWMTDVELQYPTFVAQVRDDVFRAQVGSSSRGNTVEAERADTGSGLNVAKSIGLSMVKELVPTISSLGGIPEWAKVVLKGGAMAMGWSKPIGKFMAGRMESGVFAHTNHADGTTFARNMGIILENRIEPYPGFAGQDVDEMSYNYICSIPAYHSATTWATGPGSGTLLLTIPLTPSTFEYAVSLWQYRLPVNYVAQFHRLWRGSFMFHFKIVKTSFHSGRLMLVWRPGSYTSGGTLSDSQYCYREVLDLRESNEFSVTIPYVSTTPYKAKDNNGVFPSVGVIQLFVLAPLVAPTTVTQSVSILTEVCACDDLEFAEPVRPLCYPVAPGSTQVLGRSPEEEIFDAEVVEETQEGVDTPKVSRSTKKKSADPKVERPAFKAQVLGEEECESDRSATIALTDDPICSTTMYDAVSNATHCIGEKITSIKQLLLRAAPWMSFDSPAGGSTVRFRDKFFSGVEATGYAVSRMPTNMDYLNLFAPMYALCRGSFRYLMYTTTNTNVNGTWRVSLSSVDTQFGANLVQTVAVADVNKLWNLSYNTVLAHNITAGGVEIQTPFYSSLPSKYTEINTALTAGFTSDDNMVSLRHTASSVVVVMRAAGDDFSFGFFIGVPPTIYTFGLTGSLYPGTQW